MLSVRPVVILPLATQRFVIMALQITQSAWIASPLTLYTSVRRTQLTMLSALLVGTSLLATWRFVIMDSTLQFARTVSRLRPGGTVKSSPTLTHSVRNVGTESLNEMKSATLEVTQLFALIARKSLLNMNVRNSPQRKVNVRFPQQEWLIQLRQEVL